MSFDMFYALFPRKEAKKDAMKAWTQISTAQQQQAIEAVPKHVERWAATETEKIYIPLPASWLRGWRFDDEIELPEAKPKPQLVAWWASDAGILAKGRELGIEPRPGETMFTLKDRVAGKVRAAA